MHGGLLMNKRLRGCKPWLNQREPALQHTAESHYDYKQG